MKRTKGGRMFCSQCGRNLPNEAKFCDNCGMSMVPNSVPVPITKSEPIAVPDSQASVTQINIAVPNMGLNIGGVEVSPKSKVAAFLLALFFGGLGFHNFYIGHSVTGLAQLILQILIWVLFVPTVGMSSLLEIPFAI